MYKHKSGPCSEWANKLKLELFPNDELDHRVVQIARFILEAESLIALGWFEHTSDWDPFFSFSTAKLVHTTDHGSFDLYLGNTEIDSDFILEADIQKLDITDSHLDEDNFPRFLFIEDQDDEDNTIFHKIPVEELRTIQFCS